MRVQQPPISAPAIYRQLKQLISGVVTTDGDGVKLTRLIGSSALDMLDPFLLLDCFESDDAKDYVGGFPTHPHRGFETVTYFLDGKMRHKDSAGHEGVVVPGGVQWMTAGRGILHSEMPEQTDGLLKGFQLWVNLPRSAKMMEPKYQEFPPELVGVESLGEQSEVRVIAGQTELGTHGPVMNAYTYPIYMDISLSPRGEFSQTIPDTHNGFIYVVEGEVSIGGAEGANNNLDKISASQLGVLGQGNRVLVENGGQDSRFLLVAGKPLNEPVARGGPFVMNSHGEVLQAFKDFSQGRF